MSRLLNYAHAQIRRFTHLASFSIAAIFLAALMATAATASRPRAEVLCEGDCSQLSAVGQTRTDEAFDFALGLERHLDGFSLRLTTPGNVFIEGPRVGNESVTLWGLGCQLNGVEITTTDLALGGVGGRVLDPLPTAHPSLLNRVQTPTETGDGRKLPYVKFTSDGDIYLNLSASSLGKIKIVAGGSIVGNSDSVPVPEPGTAMLFGLGLAELASVRRR